MISSIESFKNLPILTKSTAVLSLQFALRGLLISPNNISALVSSSTTLVSGCNPLIAGSNAPRRFLEDLEEPFDLLLKISAGMGFYQLKKYHGKTYQYR